MRFWKFCIFSLSALSLSGCGTVLTSYPQQMTSNLAQINAGQYQTPITTLNQNAKGNNYELYAAELGRTQQLASQYVNSSNTFLPLMKQIEADQLQAKIRASRIAMNAGALFTNDNILKYQLADYEIIDLYQYQALNFLAENNLQDALVAARKSNDLQTYLSQQYQEQIAKAQHVAKKNGLNLDFVNDQTEKFQSTLQAAASVKSSFANAMSYYLSGILFLASDDLNDASVSFQQAASIMPNNTYIENILLLTLQMQGASPSNISNYEKIFGIKALPSVPQNKAFVTVMYEQNFVNSRSAIVVPVPVPWVHQMQVFSFPSYASSGADNTPLVVNANLNGKLMPLTDTQLIVNTNALAAKDLIQQYPIIFLRASLRFMAQVGVTQLAQGSNNNNVNSDAALVAQLYFAAISQNPDLRSWLTLPANVQISQYYLAPGHYEFNFSNFSLGVSTKTDLQANHYYIIWVRQYGNVMNTQVLSL